MSNNDKMEDIYGRELEYIYNIERYDEDSFRFVMSGNHEEFFNYIIEFDKNGLFKQSYIENKEGLELIYNLNKEYVYINEKGYMGFTEETQKELRRMLDNHEIIVLEDNEFLQHL